MEDWLAALERGDADAAWDLFVSRYHRLIFATIRHYVQDYDDVMNVFARVCEALREDDLRRPRAYYSRSKHDARFSTWLVTVVRNLTVDWFRRRDGRRRLPTLLENLTLRQRRIFELVFLDGWSHVEAFELLRTKESTDLTFGEFLAELRTTYHAVGEGRRGTLLRTMHPAPPVEEPTEAPRPAETAERHALLLQALESLGTQDRLAVQLYVIEDLPAADVARITGLPNAKAVYNHVYRALAALRAHLGESGIGAGDL